MRTIGTFISYAAVVAALAGGVALAVALVIPGSTATPAAPPMQATQAELSPSPRIAAWQERIAEEKVFAERQAARDAEDKARWAALSKPRITQASADDAGSRALEERARSRSRQARAEALRLTQQAYAPEATENEVTYAPTAYAPTPNRPRYSSIYSTMRDTSGMR